MATAALNPANIASPIRRILRGFANVEVLLGDVEAVDVAARTLKLSDGEIAYDYLILATGATHSYFGHDEWAADAPGLKSIEDALDIRRRIFLAYEAAEREPDTEAPSRVDDLRGRRRRARPASSSRALLAEIARHDMIHEFHRFNPARSRVILLEAGPRVLPVYTPRTCRRRRRSSLKGWESRSASAPR